MRAVHLEALEERLYFTVEDIARLLGIEVPSARVLCTRYVNRGVFLRLKKNTYTLVQSWKRLDQTHRMRLANFLQVPSYISFMTALSYYGITTQIQREFYESASLKRTIRYDSGGASFCYYKIKKDLYFGFTRKEGLFLATQEKAFADAVYLYSFGKYRMDFASLDTSLLDRSLLERILRPFPEKTKLTVERICKT